MHPNLKHIFLAHQSLDCNNKNLCKKIMKDLLDEKQSSIKISNTYQDKISECILF